jgi:hypothetical protein
MKKLTAAAAVLGLTLAVAAFAAEDVINWKTLIKYLPETFNGLTQNEAPDGQTVKMGGMTVSDATAYYGDDDEGEVTIMSGGMAEMQFNSLKAMANMSVEGEDGYVRPLEIQGFPAVEQYDNEDRSATLMIALPNKVVVNIVHDDCDDTSTCRAVADSMNLTGLAGEK